MAVNLGTAVGYLDLDTSKFTKGFKEAKSAVSDFKEGTGGVSGLLKNVGSSMTSVGKDMTLKVTTPIVGMGVAAVKASSSLEKGLSKVKAISGATSTDMVDLKNKAIEMGSKTKFSASEAADAFTYMAMAGWKTNDMLEGIDGIMNLSAADGLDLATTSDIVTDAITAFGLSASDSSHFADVLAAASSNANTNVSMLGESFKYVAPVAGAMGYSVEDVSIALGLMANGSIKASQAGTSLRTLITNLAKPTDNMAAAMDRLGISLSDSSGKVKPLSQLMDELRASFSNGNISSEEFQAQLAKVNKQYEDGKISEEAYNDTLQDLMTSAYGVEGAEKAKYAATLAGKEGMAGLLNILSASDEDYQKLKTAIYGASDAFDGQGTAAGMSQEMLNNLDGQITILLSTLNTLAITIGDMLLPYVKAFVEKLQSLVEWLNGLDDGQKRMIVKIAAIVAAIGPVLMILGKVLSTVGTIISVVSKLGGVLGAAAGPIGIIIAAIAALYLAWKTNFAGIGDAINELAATLSEKFGEIVEHVKSIASKIKELWENDFGGIRTITETVVGVVVDVIKGLADIVSEVFGLIDSLINGDWKGVWEHFKNIGKAAIGIFAKIFQGIIKIIATILSNVIKAIINFAKNIASKMKEAASNAISNFIKFFKQLPSKMGYIIGYALGKIVKFAIDLVAKGKEAGKNFLDSVINFFKQLPVKIAIWFAKTMVKVMKFKQEFPQKAKEAAKNFKDKLVNGIKELPSKMLSIGKNIIEGVVNGMKAKIESAKESVKNFASNIVKGFKDALGIHSPSKVMKEQVGVQIANGVIAGINSKKGAAKKSASKLSQEIVDAASKRLDQLQTYNKITTAQEVDFWKKIYNATKKGTDANLTAYKNYKSAQQSLNQEILSNAEKRLDKLQTYNKISASGEVAYWKDVMGQLKKGSDEYLTAYKNYISAKKEYNQEIKDIETEYNDKVSEVYDNLKSKVDSLTQAYKDQVNNRKDSLLSTFKLFDEYQISTDKSGQDLVSSLSSQVDALKQFNTQMEELENRKILPKSLIQELRNQGVAATGELQSLNGLTDEELKKYGKLWNERNKLAKQEALRENQDAYEELQANIQKAQNTAYKKLDKLNEKYHKKLESMKDAAYSNASKVGKKTINGLIDGIESKEAQLKNSLNNTLDTVNGYMNKIGTKIDKINKYAVKASSSTEHSHRMGLSYVPYDGYRATLHEGERVLTKSEANQYNNGNNSSNNDVGDIIIPVYIGNDRLDTLVVKASERNNFRKGGR